MTKFKKNRSSRCPKSVSRCARQAVRFYSATGMSIAVWSVIAASILANGSVNAQESIPSIDSNNVQTQSLDELTRQFRKCHEELYDTLSQIDTAPIIQTGAAQVTLHHLKIRELDFRLARLRETLATAVQGEEFLRKAIENEIDPEALAWALQQGEQASHTVMVESGNEIESVLQQHYALQKWRVSRLEKACKLMNEQREFHYEKARRLKKFEVQRRDLRNRYREITEEMLLVQLSDASSDEQRIEFAETAYRKSLEQYVAAGERVHQFGRYNDNLATNSYGDGTSLVTIQGLRIQRMDRQLVRLRNELSKTRKHVDYIQTVLDGTDEEVSMALWILAQEKVVVPATSGGVKQSPQDILEQLNVKFKQDLVVINTRHTELVEEFKFHFALAKEIEAWHYRIVSIVERLHFLGDQLGEGRRVSIAMEVGVKLPARSSGLDNSQSDSAQSTLSQWILDSDLGNIESTIQALTPRVTHPNRSRTSNTLESMIEAFERELTDPQIDTSRRDLFKLLLEDFGLLLESVKRVELGNPESDD